MAAPCVFCHGDNAECAACGGTNELRVHRCPNVLVTDRERAAVRAVVMVIDQGLLPDPGGWMQQSATFVAAFPLLSKLIADHRVRIEKEALRRAEQQRR